MWNKIYLIALAVFVLVMLVLTYLAFSQLQSVGFAPVVIAENYLSYQNYYRQFLWMSSVILLILANVLLWLRLNSWALWTTLLYFAAFTLLDGWWLGRAFADYRETNNLAQNVLPFGILISTIICLVAGVGIYFNQFLVLRMRERVTPSTDSAAPVGADLTPSVEEPIEVDSIKNETGETEK